MNQVEGEDLRLAGRVVDNLVVVRRLLCPCRKGRRTFLQTINGVLVDWILLMKVRMKPHFTVLRIRERVTLLQEDVILNGVRLVDNTVVVLVRLDHGLKRIRRRER